MLSFFRHKKLSWLSAVSIASIVALLCFQAYWLYNGYNDTYNKFVADTREALQEACDSIQERGRVVKQWRTVEALPTSLMSAVSATITDTLNTPITLPNTTVIDLSQIDALQISSVSDNKTTRVSVFNTPKFSLHELDTLFRMTLAKRRLTGINYVLETESLETGEKQALGEHKPGKEVRIEADNLKLMSFNSGERMNINMGKENVVAYLQFTPFIIFKRMLWTLAVSALLFLVILYCMAAQLRVIRRQKTTARMKDDFIANFTHELKTPIAVVYAALDNIERHPERQEESVDMGKSQLRRLSDSVEKILSLSVEEHGRVNLHREETPMYDWLALTIEPFRLKTGQEVTIQLTVNPPDAKANIDHAHFAGALNNIIDNAIKYAGGQVRIDINCKKTAQGLSIAISDNGPGIAPHDIQKIFERFYRVNATAAKIKGFGLGLNYAKTIVEMHGGIIRAESEPGKGSTFTIEI